MALVLRPREQEGHYLQGHVEGDEAETDARIRVHGRARVTVPRRAVHQPRPNLPEDTEGIPRGVRFEGWHGVHVLPHTGDIGEALQPAPYRQPGTSGRPGREGRADEGRREPGKALHALGREGADTKGLLNLILREDTRTHTKYSGEERFLTFPVFVCSLCGSVGLTLDKLTETVPLSDLATFAHLSAFMYGLSVGTFGLMGRQYLERRYGRSNYLVAMPYLLPISFKTTFLGIYLRDALFYVVLMLVPATLGLFAAAPIMGFAITSIGLFFVAILVTFMFGMSM